MSNPRHYQQQQQHYQQAPPRLPTSPHNAALDASRSDERYSTAHQHSSGNMDHSYTSNQAPLPGHSIGTFNGGIPDDGQSLYSVHSAHNRSPSDPHHPPSNILTQAHPHLGHRIQHSGASLPDFGQSRRVHRPLPQPKTRKAGQEKAPLSPPIAPSFFHAKAAGQQQAAAGYSGSSTHRMSVHHGGISASAPLNRTASAHAPPIVEVPLLVEDLGLPDFAALEPSVTVTADQPTLFATNFGSTQGATANVQPPQHSTRSNSGYFQNMSGASSTARLHPGHGTPMVESPLELPAEFLLHSTIEETGAVDSKSLSTPCHSGRSRSPSHRPPPVDTQLATGSRVHARSVSDGGREICNAVASMSIATSTGVGQRTPDDPQYSQQMQQVSSPLSGASGHPGNSFFQGSGIPVTTSGSARKVPVVYPALLSRVSEAFRARISLQTLYKDSLEYKNGFNGRDAVDVLCFIIKTTDRNLALLLGRALDAQRYFHDVTYDHRLRDNANEIYQFRDDSGMDDLDAGNESMQSPDTTYDSDFTPLPATYTNDNSLNDCAQNTLPNGVFTLLADCYSPTCTRDTLCYSISCPRRLEQQARLKLQLASGLKRTSSRSGLNSERLQKLWIESVPKEISDAVSKQEQKRQEIIFEMIYTEKDFLEDLEILERLYMDPFRYANIIWDPAELEDFINQVFYNVSMIRQVVAPLVQALIKRQEEKAVVEYIGDIFLAHVDRFEPFVAYGAHQPYAKHHLDMAIQKYRELTRWLEQRERMPECRKLPIQSFLGRPTTRLARYPLLLEAVLKASPDDHPDRRNLELTVEKLRVLLNRINVEAGRADTRIRLTRLNDELVCSPTDLHELALLDPERQLIREGTLKKRANVDQVEVSVFLFDHYLLLTKRRKPKDGGGYKVHKRPIPLEMLLLTIADEPALRQATRRSSSLFTGAKGNGVGPGQSIPAPPSAASGRPSDATKAGFPITLTHLGRNGMEIVLYASSQAERRQWRDKIEAQRNVVVQSRQIFAINTLSDRHFNKNIRVNCSAVFGHGRKLVFGTDDGVYVGMEGQSEAFVKTMDIDRVHKIEILEDYNMVLMLHDKNRTLMSYPMDCLAPLEAASAKRNGRKISSHVSFFKVGVCMNRTLVCVVKSAALYSTIKTLEPVSAMNNRKKSLGLILRSTETMKVYREFYIPTESSSIHFLKTKLCVGCNKGFEVVDLETLNTLGLLDPTDEALNFVLRRESARPIAIFRIRNGDFLLCYDEFAFFVNRNGRRSRPNWLVTWEGLPSAFSINYPYILAFDAKFVEVRHVVTGALEQVIPTGALRSLNTHSDSIHCVTLGLHDYQHVFKLTRTTPTPNVSGA